MWVVNLKKVSENRAGIWLSELSTLNSGAMMATGRRTPKLTHDMQHGSIDRLCERLRKCLTILDAESVLAVDEESLIVTAEIAEQLSDVLVGGDGVEQVV